MELASPAGNAQKLFYAWSYGADAAYIGLKKFSLRMKADNFDYGEYESIAALKKQFPQKKLYCALNISFHNDDIDYLKSRVDDIARFLFDAFIVQDMGIVELLQKHFPRVELHLSTQANCVNKEAVKLYKTLGFSRVVLARETSLDEIRAIKDAAPDMALEAFAHGAMCVSYSGRCLLSSALAQRSANAGNCAHSCRWDFRALAQHAEAGGIYLEEKERPNELFPVFEGEGFTAILSSKDLCMINHLDDMRKAGVDCVKIEGRMKSAYYTAVVTRAYRKALDALERRISQEEAAPFAAELFNTPHREFTTAFYYARDEASQTAKGLTEGEYTMMGFAGKKLDDSDAAALMQKNPALVDGGKKANWNFFVFESMNKMHSGTPLEVITPHDAFLPLGEYALVEPESGDAMSWVSHGHPCLLYTAFQLGQGHILRAKQSVREPPP